MGSPPGHYVPGIFFTLYGLNWLILSLWNNFTRFNNKSRMRKRNMSVIEHRSWLPICGCPNVPIEPLLKVILPSIMVFIEIFVDYTQLVDSHTKWRLLIYSPFKNGRLAGQGRVQHILIHCSVILSGIIDLAGMCVRFPRLTTRIVLCFMFCSETAVLYFHLDGKDLHAYTFHALLVLAAFSTFLFSLLRLFAATNLYIHIGLGSCMLLQGMWLIEGGYLMFNGFLDGQRDETGEVQDKHLISLYYTEVFVGNLLGIVVFDVLVWIVLSLIAKRKVLGKGIFKLQDAAVDLESGAEESEHLLERQTNE